MGSTEKWYLTASFYSDIAIFVILTTSLCVMFLKLRLKIDVTGIVTLAVFWVSALTKLISSIQIQSLGLNGLSGAISIMSVQLVWVSLYYFTFEMKLIQIVLQQQDSQKLISQQKSIKLQMYALIVITLIYGVIYSVYRIYERDAPEEFDENYEFISTALLIGRSFKFLGDLYLHLVFILVFKYLLQYRSLMQGQRELETNEPQKQLSKIIILWVLLLFILNLWNACNTIMVAIFQLELGKDYLQSIEYELVLILVKFVFPIKDFFIAMSLIWLFIDQGLKQQRQLMVNSSYGNSLIDNETQQINQLLTQEEDNFNRMSKQQFNNIMRAISVEGTQNKQKSMKMNQPQVRLSMAPHEIGNSHENHQFDLNVGDEDMNIEQFTPTTGPQSIFDNAQFRNFIFDNFISNAKLPTFAGSMPQSIPY